MIYNLPEWLEIFLFSMIPGFESRFTVPVIAMYEYGWEWWQAYPIAIAGNMILVPFGLLFFYKIEEYLKRYNSLRRLMDKVFERIRYNADKKIKRYESIALIFFVAVPLPFTGAGLGVVIAYLFDLKFKTSIIMIFIGVLISTSITTIAYLMGSYLFFR